MATYISIKITKDNVITNKVGKLVVTRSNLIVKRRGDEQSARRSDHGLHSR